MEVLVECQCKTDSVRSSRVVSCHPVRLQYAPVIYLGWLNLRFVPFVPLPFLIMKPNNSTRITGIRHIHAGRRGPSKSERSLLARDGIGRQTMSRVNCKHESRGTDNKCDGVVLFNRRTDPWNVFEVCHSFHSFITAGETSLWSIRKAFVVWRGIVLCISAKIPV